MGSTAFILKFIVQLYMLPSIMIGRAYRAFYFFRGKVNKRLYIAPAIHLRQYGTANKSETKVLIVLSEPLRGRKSVLGVAIRKLHAVFYNSESQRFLKTLPYRYVE